VFPQGRTGVIANLRSQPFQIQLSLMWSPFLPGSPVFSSKPVPHTPQADLKPTSRFRLASTIVHKSHDFLPKTHTIGHMPVSYLFLK